MEGKDTEKSKALEPSNLEDENNSISSSDAVAIDKKDEDISKAVDDCIKSKRAKSYEAIQDTKGHQDPKQDSKEASDVPSESQPHDISIVNEVNAIQKESAIDKSGVVDLLLKYAVNNKRYIIIALREISHNLTISKDDDLSISKEKPAENDPVEEPQEPCSYDAENVTEPHVLASKLWESWKKKYLDSEECCTFPSTPESEPATSFPDLHMPMSVEEEANEWSFSMPLPEEYDQESDDSSFVSPLPYLSSFFKHQYRLVSDFRGGNTFTSSVLKKVRIPRNGPKSSPLASKVQPPRHNTTRIQVPAMCLRPRPKLALSPAAKADLTLRDPSLFNLFPSSVTSTQALQHLLHPLQLGVLQSDTHVTREDIFTAQPLDVLDIAGAHGGRQAGTSQSKPGSGQAAHGSSNKGQSQKGVSNSGSAPSGTSSGVSGSGASGGGDGEPPRKPTGNSHDAEPDPESKKEEEGEEDEEFEEGVKEEEQDVRKKPRADSGVEIQHKVFPDQSCGAKGDGGGVILATDMVGIHKNQFNHNNHSGHDPDYYTKPYECYEQMHPVERRYPGYASHSPNLSRQQSPSSSPPQSHGSHSPPLHSLNSPPVPQHSHASPSPPLSHSPTPSLLFYSTQTSPEHTPRQYPHVSPSASPLLSPSPSNSRRGSPPRSHSSSGLSGSLSLASSCSSLFQSGVEETQEHNVQASTLAPIPLPVNNVAQQIPGHDNSILPDGASVQSHANLIPSQNDFAAVENPPNQYLNGPNPFLSLAGESNGIVTHGLDTASEYKSSSRSSDNHP